MYFYLCFPCSSSSPFTVHVLLCFILLLVVLLLFHFIICLHHLRLLSLSAKGAVRKTLLSCSNLLFSILLRHYFFDATYVSICHYQLITLYILNEVGTNSCRHYHMTFYFIIICCSHFLFFSVECYSS